MKYFQHLIDKFILSLVGRSFTILADKDPRIIKELDYLPDQFTAAVAIEEKEPYIIVVKEKKQIKYYGFHSEIEKVDFKLYFKNEEFAYQVLAAKEGIRQAFAEHKVVLEGNIESAISIIYIFEIVEAYLMPNKFSVQVLRYKLDRKISRFKLLWKALTLAKEKGEFQ